MNKQLIIQLLVGVIFCFLYPKILKKCKIDSSKFNIAVWILFFVSIIFKIALILLGFMGLVFIANKFSKEDFKVSISIFIIFVFSLLLQHQLLGVSKVPILGPILLLLGSYWTSKEKVASEYFKSLGLILAGLFFLNIISIMISIPFSLSVP